MRKESLDSLDDDMSTDASVQQQRLFQRAFGQIMERTEESFQVFRSVLQLTPTSVLLQDIATGRDSNVIRTTQCRSLYNG